MIVVGVAIAGALGALSRSLLDRAIERRVPSTFPYGTLTINVTGSLLLGVLVGLVVFAGSDDTAAIVLGTGFCGAYTTYSTFAFETVRLAQDEPPTRALLNVSANVVLGLLAAGAGLAIASLV